MVEKYNIDDANEIIVENETPQDDIELDEEEGILNDKLKLLKQKLSACEEEKRGHLEELQRTRADFLNSKRRIEEQAQREKERAKDKILIELLTLFDSFDTAMADKEVWESVDVKWRSGVEAIQSKLQSILTAHYITPIESVGKQFNPEEHEAVSNIQVDDNSRVDTVIAVLQKGFKRGDTIIRPARVVVGTQ